MSLPKSLFFSFLLFSLLTACGPKVIESKTKNPAQSTGIFSESSNEHPPDQEQVQAPSSQSFSEDVHRVVVHEVLPTEKYVYLHVHEGVEKFWIAARKQEIQIGGTYFYRGGLLKTNFESKEYNRVFDRIFLVSKLVAANHGNGNASQLGPIPSTSSASASESRTKENVSKPTSGSMLISELLANPQAYEGKTVQLTGTCVKLNANIMSRNWVHLQDGSKDEYDLVITTSAMVQEGQKVTLRAVVGLNRDFGAGYTYDLILEDGVIVQ